LHFPQIIWLAMKSSKPREWTELEVKTLIFMSGQRLSAEEISKSLGRYVGSVKTKARELGLVAIKKRSKAHRWSATDDY
jgi:predicted NAD/FAD-dependent oxidoreductase